jgi:hypothetical protein
MALEPEERLRQSSPIPAFAFEAGVLRFDGERGKLGCNLFQM